jgi:hypothetical protein
MLVLPDHPYGGQPVLLTEFGGIGYADDTAGTWGYTRAQSAQELASAYERLLATVRDLAPLSGFCYTQFADTYQEANGLLYMDRTPKFPLDQMARAARHRLRRNGSAASTAERRPPRHRLTDVRLCARAASAESPTSGRPGAGCAGTLLRGMLYSTNSPRTEGRYQNVAWPG